MRPFGRQVTVGARGYRAASLALALIAAQLTGATHLVLVRHVVCPLDGELVHAEEDAGAQGAGPVHGVNERSPEVAPSERREAHHGHGHCALAALRRDESALRGAALELRSPAQAALARLSPEDVSAAVSLTLHWLAPKQSPPA